MRTFLAFFSILLFWTPVAAGQPVAITPKFTAGQVLLLELKKTREDNRAGRPVGVSTTPVTLRVLKAGANGFVVDWVPSDTQFDDPAQASNPVIQMASKVLKGFHMEAILNSSGAFQRLQNQSSVEAKMQLVVDRLMKQLVASIPEESRSRTLEAMGRLVTPRTLIAAATKEIQLYFALYGMEIEEGKPVEETLDVPNPIGDGTLPTQIRVQLNEIDSSTGEVQFALEQRYDEKVLLSLLPQALGIADSRLSRSGRSNLGSMVDTGHFTYHSISGCMRRIRHERSIALDRVRRLDRTEISLLKSN